MAFWKLFGGGKIEEYRKRLDRDPNDAEAHFYLGVEYEKRGQFKKAIGAFEEVIRLNPRSAEVHYNVAVLYEETGDGRNAIKHMVMAGNLFSEKNDTPNRDKARKTLHELHKKFNLSPEDLKRDTPATD